MANRRQPPRPGSSTPVRRPKVAGIRRPGAESETTSLNRPSPRPRPEPEPVEPAAVEPDVVEPVDGPQLVEPVGETEVVEPAAEETSVVDEPEEPAGKPKPSPRPKARDAGVPKPSSEAEAEELSSSTEVLPARPKRRAGLIPLLLVVAVAFAGLAVWFKIEESEVSASTDNTALLDVAKTAQVKQAVTSAAEALFSYDFNDIAKTENAANDLLVNDEVRQKYNGFMGEVKRLAPEQKMVVTMKVTRSAVVMIDGDRAKVMVSADQTSTRTAQNQTSAGGAQMWFTTELRDGKWKITDLNTYSGGQPAQPTTPAPAPASPAPPG